MSRMSWFWRERVWIMFRSLPHRFSRFVMCGIKSTYLSPFPPFLVAFLLSFLLDIVSWCFGFWVGGWSGTLAILWLIVVFGSFWMGFMSVRSVLVRNKGVEVGMWGC